VPIATNAGIRTYYEVEGNGPPLILAHGSSDTLNVWRRLGYVDALKDEFKLVLFDARGHGRSDKPHDESSYTSKLMVNDVVAVLDDLGISKAHYYGYSMGARTGFRIALQSALRFESFVLGGCSPYKGEAELQFFRDVLEGLRLLLVDPEAALFRREEALGRSLSDEEKNTFLANDAEALIASATARFDWPPLTHNELSIISVPCLLYCGDLDAAYAGTKESASYLPDAQFVSLGGLDHTQALVRKDIVLPYLKKFLARMSAS
jgi:pimeloyl-ACP methyl ester carboxylesterase